LRGGLQSRRNAGIRIAARPSSKSRSLRPANAPRRGR
jgi:hypothetical protein